MATHDKSCDGGFSDPSYLGVGDPFVQAKEKARGVGGDHKPFSTCPPKKGQTGATFGPSARKFEAMAGEYAEQYKLQAKRRLENTAGFVKPNGFAYASPAQEHTGAGDYYGAFGKFERDEEDLKRAQAEQVKPPPNPKERVFEKKNMLAQPGKRGTFGYAGTLIGGQALPAMAAEFDSVRQANKRDAARHRELMGDRKPFRSRTEGVDLFDSHEHVAASKALGWDDECLARPPGALELLNPKERAAAKAATYKAWKPNNHIKDGEDGVFEKFPEQLPDPYDEKVVTRAMLPLRRNPVKVATKDLPDSLKDRKAFRPTNHPKTKLTRGTCLMGITKHHV